MPQLLRSQPWMCPTDGPALVPFGQACPVCHRTEASCGERMDLQTVMVNHLAAGVMINVLSWLLLRIPFVAAGAFFSTLNTMTPIRLTGVAGSTLLPETTYADGGPDGKTVETTTSPF